MHGVLGAWNTDSGLSGFGGENLEILVFLCL